MVPNTPVELWQEHRGHGGGYPGRRRPRLKVRFEISPTQLHSGISIVGINEFLATDARQAFR